MKFTEWIRGGFTCSDGTMDDARLAAMLMVLTFLGNSIAVVYTTHAFDMQSFGIGAGALAAGVGVWFGQRANN